jgi:hypothetical protein
VTFVRCGYTCRIQSANAGSVQICDRRLLVYPALSVGPVHEDLAERTVVAIRPRAPAPVAHAPNCLVEVAAPDGAPSSVPLRAVRLERVVLRPRLCGREFDGLAVCERQRFTIRRDAHRLGRLLLGNGLLDDRRGGSRRQLRLRVVQLQSRFLQSELGFVTNGQYFNNNKN